jgi:hypothetical protein
VSRQHLRAALARGGFAVTAPLPVELYDSLVPDVWRAERVQPGTRAILVVANGGRALWPLFRASPEFSLETDPLDRYTRRVFDEATGDGAAFALYFEQRDDTYLPLVALAERAGIGAPGRVGVLLHPEYGPWLSIRGLVFATETVPFREPEPFSPCTGCPAPCESACHGQVVSSAGVDVEGCYRTRLTLDACALRCDARAACVVGPEHAFPPEQVAHHSLIRRRRDP